MKAMILNSYGADAKFEAAEVDQPVIKPGHVLVKIAASSVNTVDTMIRNMGKELPLSPATPAIVGIDFAGTVEAVGEGVARRVHFVGQRIDLVDRGPEFIGDRRELERKCPSGRRQL